MKHSRVLEFLFAAALAFLCASAVVWWRAAPQPSPKIASAGRDGAEGRTAGVQKVEIGRDFRRFSELSDAERAAGFPDWPRFRGADMSNCAASGMELDFNLENAKILWKIPLGEGYAAPVVWGNRVYVLDYDEESESDALRAFALSDGRELWRRSYKVKIRRNHGKSRTVPCVSEGAVVTFGPMGQVMCADAETGDFLWGRDMVSEYGSEIPQWYSGQCPLVDSGEAVIAPAGKDALMFGADLRTGEVKWTAPNPGGFKMSHSSVMKMEFFGKPMFVYCAAGGIAGVSAAPGDRGKLLWTVSDWKPNVFAPSPVKISDSKMFLTAGYGAGGAVLELSLDGEKWSAAITGSWKAKAGAACEQQTPVVYGGRLYTVLPKDAGGRNSLLAACDIRDDCKILFESPRGTRFGIGPYMVVDGMLLVLDDDGRLTALSPGADSFEIVSRRKVLDGVDSWGPMAFTGGLLILRDSMEMVCLDLRKAAK